jgi:ribosomal protein S18 acetylase RimI-like enzyme
LSGFRVRIAQASDAPLVAALVTGFRNHLGATHPTAEELAELLPRLIASDDTEFCLAFSGTDRSSGPTPVAPVGSSDSEQEPLGYTQCRFFHSLWARGREAHLEDLFVAAAARGQGAGSALMAFALARARERGCVAIGLHTNERNERAHVFYRRGGFEPQSEARWPGGQEVFWRRSLA